MCERERKRERKSKCVYRERKRERKSKCVYREREKSSVCVLAEIF